MRVFVACLISLLSALPTAAGEGDLPPPAGRERLTSVVPADPGKAFDALFADLAAAEDATRAAGIEADIRARWMLSGSATADQLLAWTDAAAADGNVPLALDILDELTVRAPAFAEAYYRRATLNVTTGRLSAALADLRTVLRIEPRHFLALRELASLFERLGDRGRALEVLRRLKAVDRHFEGIDDAIKTLSEPAPGRDI